MTLLYYYDDIDLNSTDIISYYGLQFKSWLINDVSSSLSFFSHDDLDRSDGEYEW